VSGTRTKNLYPKLETTCNILPPGSKSTAHVTFRTFSVVSLVIFLCSCRSSVVSSSCARARVCVLRLPSLLSLLFSSRRWSQTHLSAGQHRSACVLRGTAGVRRPVCFFVSLLSLCTFNIEVPLSLLCLCSHPITTHLSTTLAFARGVSVCVCVCVFIYTGACVYASTLVYLPSASSVCVCVCVCVH
jgi:hypothetical protein